MTVGKRIWVNIQPAVADPSALVLSDARIGRYPVSGSRIFSI
ncbi:hypothetical protein RESH_03492 [Rhodopirellula europaea SH398]|uniref:Uncharacterized protein n=1 Tax=Rhodopirellula europaea SH398 TaxID=1263868 RepID=M5S342_9BACT|nr:hypothetical protein RESH_03492 [Rhodopirellula europaea SH398]